MERLTEYQKAQKWLEGFDWDNEPESCDNLATICEALQEIEKIKAKKEQGLLIELPCKVGDTVYRIYDDCDFPGDCHTKRMCKGCEYKNLFIEEQAFCLSMLHQDGTLGHPYYKSRSEAEEALAKMRGEKNGISK